MKRKVIFKSIALCLAIMMMTLTFAGCNNNKNKQAANAGVPTVDYLLPWDPGLPISSELWAIQKWGEAVGVKFNINSPPRDAFQEKFTAMVTSKNLPDMVNFFKDSFTYKDYGPQLFVALDEYIDGGKLPNFKRWLDKYPEIRESMSHPTDGKMYGFPFIQDFEGILRGWYIRNDMLAKVGLDASNINTLEDLKTALLKLRALKNDYIVGHRGGISSFISYSGAYFGVAEGAMFDNKGPNGTNQFVYGPMLPEYEEWVKFAKWMYDNKILIPSFATMNDQEYFAKLANGTFLMSMEQHGMEDRFNPTNDPKIDVQPIYPFEVNGVRYKQPQSSHINIGYRWPVVISKESKNIDAIIKAMDFIYSDKGIELLMLGEEGVTFTKDPSAPYGYKMDKVQSEWTRNADGSFSEGVKKLQDYGCFTWWLSGVAPLYARYNLLNYKSMDDPSATRTQKIIQKNIDLGYTVPADPSNNFTKEERSKRAELQQPISTYVTENTLKFITGQRPMSEFEQFRQELRNMGVDEVIKMNNDNYKKLKEKK